MAHELVHLDVFDDTVISDSCNALKEGIVDIVSHLINKIVYPLGLALFLQPDTQSLAIDVLKLFIVHFIVFAYVSYFIALSIVLSFSVLGSSFLFSFGLSAFASRTRLGLGRAICLFIFRVAAS